MVMLLNFLLNTNSDNIIYVNNYHGYMYTDIFYIMLTVT